MASEVVIGGITGIAALLFALYFAFRVKREEPGTTKMQDISAAIKKGASTFLGREFKTLTAFTIILAVILAVFLGTGIALSYVLGTVVSSLAAFVSMGVATSANVRTANAVQKSYAKALKIALSGGAVLGMSVVGFGMLGLLAVFIFTQEIEILLGFAFGASLTALFLRVGGGIYTKSADVGADLVGKVEKGIPEDDPRNPAVIADNVGDNVGDIAGMGSDLFESYVSAIVAAMALGILTIGIQGAVAPILLGAAGIAASIIGVLAVRPKEVSGGFEKQIAQATKTLNTGVMASNIAMIVLGYIVITLTLSNGLPVFGAMLVGLVAGYVIGRTTEYYTSGSYSPVRGIAQASQTGAGTNVIEGLAVGMLSTVIPVIVVVAATLAAFHLAGLYGIAIAAVGMLVNLGMLLSIDGYGPIADNAAGIAEMAKLGKAVRERAEALDSVGNTTAAIGKGFAIASAALAALAWLAAYFEIAKIDVLSITEPDVITGVFVGSMLVFLFAALTMRSVAKGAQEMVNEVRRQFKRGILKGKAEPDYARCVDITTKRAIKEMLLPGLIVIIVPILLGVALGLKAVGGLLVGALATGFLVALMMSNAGGAWDNAKKYIEAGNLGGKGSDAHKASVIGDTVGDPFKDTAGPSLNILIKLVGKIAIIFTPLFLAL